jgi:hypothetical protein
MSNNALYQSWNPCPWQDAPIWAQWAAMDRRGGWFWYEVEPRDEDGYFSSAMGRIAQFHHLPYPAHWRLSLHHRPNPPVSFFSHAEIQYVQLSA